MSSSFCVLPFIHLETRTDGRVSPCCISRETLKKSSAEDFHLSEDGITRPFQSDEMNHLRQDLLNSVKNKNCEVCWREESAGQISKRHRENERFSHLQEGFLRSGQPLPFPIYLDLKLGNTCNLKCRICGPNNSSKWMEEFLNQNSHDGLHRGTAALKALSREESRKKIMAWPDFADVFWSDLDQSLQHIQRFEFFGGEPFLNKKHFEILKRSVQIGSAKNQSLHYNTNGTVFPKEAIESIFPHFKEVKIMFSIDGTGDRFEYQRYPAKFESVLENFLKIKKAGLDVEVCSTVSALTIFNIFEDIEFWAEHQARIYLNGLYEPYFFETQNLPFKAKQAVLAKKEKYAGLLNTSFVTNSFEATFQHMMAPSDEKSFLFFWSYIQATDKVRHQSFEKTFPEWARILKSENV